MTHMSDERPESLKSYLGADPGDADRSRCSIACEDSMNWMYIVCHSYYDAMRSCRLIGGVETYVNSLISLAKQRGYSAVILQQGPEHPDIRLEDGTTIKYWQSLDEVATELRDLQEVAPGIIVYSDFPCTPARVEHPSVIIQHGVGWDYRGPTRQNPIVEQLYKTTLPVRHYLLHHRIRRLAQAVDRVICVDTNFVNFLRTRFVSDDWDGRLVYVPNFAPSLSPEAALGRWRRRPQRLRCICPRRFTRIRGAVLFARVVSEIADRYPEVDFAFLGRGEEESEIRLLVAGRRNVEVKAVPHEEMLEEYRRSHLVVIPTIAAEGTSLSCIEAMAAGCAVVATTVGGLGNIVLPDFNGEMCAPTRAGVREAVSGLLSDYGRMRRYAENGYAVATQAFSNERWQARVWAQIQDVVTKHLSEARAKTQDPRSRLSPALKPGPQIGRAHV